MTKAEFLAYVQEKLSALSFAEQQRSLTYYEELIEDYREDGMTEEEAIARLGDPEEITKEILAEAAAQEAAEEAYTDPKQEAGPTYYTDPQPDQPYNPAPQQAAPRRGMGTGTVLLLVLGFPLWFPLLMTGLLLLLVFYILLFIPIIIFGALAVGLGLSGIAGLLVSPFALMEALPMGVFQIGGCIFLIGIAILCALATVGLWRGVLFIIRKSAGAIFSRKRKGVSAR